MKNVRVLRSILNNTREGCYSWQKTATSAIVCDQNNSNTVTEL